MATTKTLTDDQGRIVCAECVVADSLPSRMKGLLGRKELHPGEGLFLPKTGSIHTFFMGFPIDAVFLDRDLAVRSVTADLKPYRVAWQRGARNVLELGAGESRRFGIEEGSRLVWNV